MPKSSPKVTILDDTLMDHIAGLDADGQEDWIFLTPHEELPGRWRVDSLSNQYFIDFEEMIGRYRAVGPARIQDFLDEAERLQYKVAWTHDPERILDAWAHLGDHPPFKLNSDLHHALYAKGEDEAAACVEATGMLPYQVQGYNYLRTDELRGGLAVWSTGTGKTVLMTALTKWFLYYDPNPYELALLVVKSNNKFDTQMKIKQAGDLDSILIDGYKPSKRLEKYSQIEEQLDAGPLVAVCNYEKFREDQEFFEAIFTGRRILIHWDEMPTKLSNRESQLYQSVRDVLYEPMYSETTGNLLPGRISWDQRRAVDLRQYIYSATPIEHAPDGLFNQVRLVDPVRFPSIASWEKKYVAARSPFNHKPKAFRDLELFGMELEDMTHQVDKTDPDIAKMFPRETEETIYVDWSPQDRKVYLKLQAIAEKLMEEAQENPETKKLTPIQLIGVLQMLCDAPAMVQKSASSRAEFERMMEEAVDEDELEGLTPQGAEAAWTLVQSLPAELTNKHCQKLVKLRELLTVKHPNTKALVFTTWGGYGLPELEAAFDEWGISYVTFKGTDKQRQEAKERFRNDPSVQVFLSSDAGSDSIDLPEAQVVIHYNLPWSWAKLIQRQNRAHRVNSQHEYVYFYMLLMADSVEFRKVEIISRKLGFHKTVFKGVIAEEAMAMRLTAADFWYMLTGEVPDY